MQHAAMPHGAHQASRLLVESRYLERSRINVPRFRLAQVKVQTAGAAGNEDVPLAKDLLGTGIATTSDEDAASAMPAGVLVEEPVAEPGDVMLPPPVESEPAVEPTMEPVAEPVAEPAAPEPAEPVMEQPAEEAHAVEEPVAVEPPVEEQALVAAKVELPEDWQKFNKAKLLELAAQMDIDTSDMPSNKMLIARISEKA